MESQRSLSLNDFLLQVDLSVENLNKIKQYFIDNNDNLTKEMFVDCFNEIFEENHCYAIEIFNEIDQISISWNDFFDYLAAKLQPTDIVQLLELGNPEYATPPHLKNDPIVKIVSLETDLYFSYAIISKYGCVGLYDGNFNFLTSYMIIMAREDIRRRDAQRRRKNRWITDAIYLEDVLMLVVASTTRTLSIYDASGLKHVPLWIILGFPDIIQSLSYTHNKDRKNLYLGSEYGTIDVLRFQQPKDKLLRVKRNGKITIFYFQELFQEKKYVCIKRLGRFHTNSVCSMQHFRNDKLFITCSRDNVKSAIIKNLEDADENYIFKQLRGVNCFAISDNLKLLITGSDDNVVRIWNYLVPSQPLAKLRAHKCGIIDVAIIEGLEVFLSCSRDAVLKLWDLKEYKCLQDIRLSFPLIENTTLQWGAKCIYSGPKRSSSDTDKFERDCLLITCCNFYAKIPLYFMDGKERAIDASVLPPQPLQNSVLIPNTWQLSETHDKEIMPEDKEVKISANIDHLNFILNKDILRESEKTDINYKISSLEAMKYNMKWPVSQCSPYLALQLQDIQEITLKPDLPTSSSRKIKNLIEKTRTMLNEASTKNIIFSDISSSSRSSRSSVIEFES